MTKPMSLRTLCLLLCLCLMSLPGLAEGQQPTRSLFGNELIEQNQELRSLAVLDGKAYLLSSQAAYRYSPGDERPQQVGRIIHGPGPEAGEPAEGLSIHVLFTREGQLMGLNRLQGTLYRLSDDGQQLTAQHVKDLDWSAFLATEADAGGSKEYPGYLVVQESKLYCRIQNYGEEDKPELFEIDLDSGAVRPLKTRHLHKPVPYKEGKLLALHYDRSTMNYETGMGDPAKLCIYDPVKDEAQMLPHTLQMDKRLDQGSQLLLYYDRQGDRIYAATDTQLMLLQEQGDPLPTGSLPMASIWPNVLSPAIQPFTEDLLLVAMGPAAVLRGMDPAAYRPNAQLIHYGGYDSVALSKALLQLDSVDVKLYEEGMMEDEKLSQMLMNKSLKADTLSLNSNGMDLQRLVQKGYLLDLSDDEELVTLAKRTWPQLHKLMFQDGKLYLLPTSLFSVRSLANTPAFQAIGRPIPRTMEELLDLFDWWLQEGMAKHPELRIVDQAEVKKWLKHTAIRCYTDGLIGAGEPLQFDMERFGMLVQRIEAMDTAPLEINPEEDPFSNGSDNGPSLEGQVLIMSMHAFTISNQTADKEPLLLALDDQHSGYAQGMADMLGINAGTAHPGEAKRFLKLYLKGLPTQLMAGLLADWAEPLENPQFERTNQNYLDTIAMLEKRLAETAEGPEQREREQELKSFRQAHEEHVANFRYRISPEGIQKYQQATKLCYVDDSLSRIQNRSFYDEQGSSLYEQYIQGAIPVEQFVKQANDRLRLMVLEGQ